MIVELAYGRGQIPVRIPGVCETTVPTTVLRWNRPATGRWR